MKDLLKHLQENISPVLSQSRTDEVKHIEMVYRVIERYNKARKLTEKKVFSNGRCDVVKIDTYEEGVKYGKGARWSPMMPSDDGKRMWDMYKTRQRWQFYVVIPHNNDAVKVAVAIDINGNAYYYTADDKPMSKEDFETFATELGIPMGVAETPAVPGPLGNEAPVAEKKLKEDFAEEHGIGKAEDTPKVEEPKKLEEPKGDSDVGGEKKSEGAFEVTDELIAKVGQELGIDFEAISKEEFKKGLGVEQEHIDVTQNDPNITGQIAFAHLQEIPDYYTRLAKMEAEYKKEKDNEKLSKEDESGDGHKPEVGDEKSEKDETSDEKEEGEELGEGKVDDKEPEDTELEAAKRRDNLYKETQINKKALKKGKKNEALMGEEEPMEPRSDINDEAEFEDYLWKEDAYTLKKILDDGTHGGPFQISPRQEEIIRTIIRRKELGEKRTNEVSMPDMKAAEFQLGRIKDRDSKKSPFKPMGKEERANLPKGSEDCHCIVRHARKPEEREALKKRLEYFRRIGDSQGIAMAMAQLGKCACDEASAFDRGGSIWGSHPPRRTDVAEKPKCPKCGSDLDDVGSYKWDCPNGCLPMGLELGQIQDHFKKED